VERSKEAAMKSPWLRSGVLGPVVALMWASAAGAQPIASSLEDVKALVGANPTVTVTDTSGQEFRGTITDAAESKLSLRIAGATRRFQAADVRTIRVRTSDSLVNGALIGAAIGGGLTSLYFLDNECHDDPACYQARGGLRRHRRTRRPGDRRADSPQCRRVHLADTRRPACRDGGANDRTWPQRNSRHRRLLSDRTAASTASRIPERSSSFDGALRGIRSSMTHR
jgi:hypothetical protein